jgi:rhodanese-related sulfurtransferase
MCEAALRAAREEAVSDEENGRWHRIHRSVGGLRWLILVMVLLALALGIGFAVWNRRLIGFDLVGRITTRKFPTVQWLDRTDFAAWRADAARVQPVVLDARSPQEYGVSHLRGAERIDPRAPAFKAVAAFPRDTPVVVYCRVGYRSARVALWLHRQGFRNVYALTGGLFAWANEGRPLEANGRSTLQVHPYSSLWGKLLQPDVRADVPPIADPLSLP